MSPVIILEWAITNTMYIILFSFVLTKFTNYVFFLESIIQCLQSFIHYSIKSTMVSVEEKCVS